MGYNNNIIEAIETIVDSKIKDLKLDSTIVAIISKVISEYSKQYEVQYEGNTLTVYSLNDKYKVGDSVYIKIPQNDLSKRLYIEGLSSAELETEQNTTMLVPIGQNFTVNLNNENIDLSELKDELELTNGYALLSMKIKINEGQQVLEQGDYGLTLQRADKDQPTEILFNTLDFEGNYFRFFNFFSQQRKIIKLSYDLIDEKILYKINSFDETEGTRFYPSNVWNIQEIKIQPIKIIDFADSKFYSYIYENSSSQLKAMFYEKGINITNACGITWYYKKEAADKEWVAFSNNNLSYLNLTDSYYCIKVIGTYKEEKLEAYYGNYDYTLEDNVRCFVYSEEGEIASTYTSNEYIVGHNYDPSKEMIKWVLGLDEKENILSLDSFYNPEVTSSMLTHLWVDNKGQAHYKIQKTFLRNATNNILTAIVYDLQGVELRRESIEVYFVKEGDQGTSDSEYNLLIKPCDQNGNITQDISEGQEIYRILLFHESQLISFPKDKIEYSLEKNKYGYSDDEYSQIFDKLGAFSTDLTLFYMNPFEATDDQKKNDEQIFIHFSFKIINSVNRLIRYTLVRQRTAQRYPQYILYSADGIYKDYEDSNEQYRIDETEKNPFFDSEENAAKEQLYCYWNDNGLYPVLKFRNVFSVDASTVIINGMTLEEYIKSLIGA